jgi:hypothetical protein
MKILAFEVEINVLAAEQAFSLKSRGVAFLGVIPARDYPGVLLPGRREARRAGP